MFSNEQKQGLVWERVNLIKSFLCKRKYFKFSSIKVQIVQRNAELWVMGRPKKQFPLDKNLRIMTLKDVS